MTVTKFKYAFKRMVNYKSVFKILICSTSGEGVQKSRHTIPSFTAEFKNYNFKTKQLLHRTQLKSQKARMNS